MMKNKYGIQVLQWGNQVSGIDLAGQEFTVPSKFDGGGVECFVLNGQTYLRDEFKTEDGKNLFIQQQTRGIFQYLDLSTGHISRETDSFLSEQCTLTDSILVVYAKELGYFISVELEVNPELPDDLKAVMEYALAQECYWILMDRDGTIHDDLPFHDW